MNENKIWLREPNDRPRLSSDEWTYHLEKEKFVSYLEFKSRAFDIKVMDDTVVEISQDDNGVSGLRLESGGVVNRWATSRCSASRPVPDGGTFLHLCPHRSPAHLR